MSLNLSELRTYVRDLTGIYSTDIITDALLTRWINEAYRELTRSQNWPWASSVVDLVTATDVPAFDGEYHAYLAYRVAVRALGFEADDTQRAQLYNGEAETIYSQMVLKYLQGQAHSTDGNMASLIRNVRDYLVVYSDTISDDFIEARIMDVYAELFEGHVWPFARNPFPGMGWGYTRVLVLGAAGRLGLQAGRDAAFVETMANEYQLAYEELKTAFLRTSTGTGYSNLGQLRSLVRTVTGDYSKLIPNVLIDLWINEEYQLLASEKDWTWLERTDQIPVQDGANQFYLLNGTRKVLEMYVVEGADPEYSASSVSQSEIVYPVPHIMDIERNSEKFNYDVSSNGLVTISPTPERDITVRVRYIVSFSPLTNDLGQPGFDEQFRSILAYRVGMRVAAYTNADKNIMDLCVMVSQNMFDAMNKFYQLEHSMEAFQLGGKSMESRKYLPWFRTA
jgi:hypothetical protein